MAQFEANAVDTLVQDVQSLLVGLCGVSDSNVLADIPLVRVFLVTTHEGELAGQGVRCLEVFQVLTTVEGLHVEPFVGSPYESLLEVGTFQVHFNLVQPLLGGRRLELAEEFLFVCHKNDLFV